MTTDIPDWIAFFAIVGMEEFRLILKGIIVFIAYDLGFLEVMQSGFHTAHNETFSVAAIVVDTVRSIGGYKSPFPISRTRSVYHRRVRVFQLTWACSSAVRAGDS